MKSVAALLLLLTIVFFSNCKKSANRPNPVNCNNLITDTLGTNDTARIFAVTAFSPNGDHRNDLYQVFTVGVNSIDVKVYDENNSVAFNTTQLNAPGTWGWRVSAGWSPVVGANTYVKYYYSIQATTNSNHKIGICGDLYLTNCFPQNPNLGLYIYESQLTRNGFLPGLSSGELTNNICP